MAYTAIKKVLLPLDGTELVEATVPYATGIARAIGAGIVLFRVVDSAGRKEAADDYLENIAAGLREGGMGVATAVGVGPVADQVVSAARRYNTGLIVMTGNASGPVSKNLLGSTAHSVLRHCMTPVLIIPLSSTKYLSPAAVVVGHDGTANADVVLAPAVALASVLSAEVVLVRSVDAVSGLGGAARYYRAVDDFAQEDLEELRQELQSSGLDVSTHVGKRSPETELLTVAGTRAGSVIAISTGNLSADLNVLGSTADRLVRSQAHPVLAVPEL